MSEELKELRSIKKLIVSLSSANKVGLERVIRLFEDLFILQAVQWDADRHRLRKILGVRRDRVSRISRLVKQESQGKGKAATENTDAGP